MMWDKFDSITYTLMRNFNTLDIDQINRLPIPTVFSILDKLEEEAREIKRQQRVAEKKSKMGRR